MTIGLLGIWPELFVSDVLQTLRKRPVQDDAVTLKTLELFQPCLSSWLAGQYWVLLSSPANVDWVEQGLMVAV